MTAITIRMVESFNSMPIGVAARAKAWDFAENIMEANARYTLGAMVENYKGTDVGAFTDLAWSYLMDMYAYGDNNAYRYSRESAKACIAIAYAIVNNPDMTGVSRKTGNRANS